MVTKRIVAIPGDVVTTRAPYPESKVVVPAGHVWVEGENPDARKSHDSNWYGAVSQSLIVGRMGGVVWPWSKRGRIEGEWKEHQRVREGNGEGFVEMKVYR